MKKPFEHTLSNGKKIRVVFQELEGLYEEDLKQITIKPGLKGRELLSTAIHELLHAELPELSEKSVISLEKSIMRLITKIQRCNKS